MKSISTIPKVIKYDDLSIAWFVYFRYNKKLFRYKFGINYINNYKKRLIETESIRDVLLQKLKEGWNPSIPETIDSRSDLILIEALNFALDKKLETLAKKTKIDYTCTVKFTITAINKLKLDQLLIIETKRIHIKLILEKIKKQRS
ncbi:hypothetical protein [Flavobacterium sp. FlaQc-50]|jgi:hypothetical protein|uniref:hypothetical protein n=1 Tax=unclassified Flavobacterium TaxID=196869 RepID=UPI0037579E50